MRPLLLFLFFMQLDLITYAQFEIASNDTIIVTIDHVVLTDGSIITLSASHYENGILIFGYTFKRYTNEGTLLSIQRTTESGQCQLKPRGTGFLLLRENPSNTTKFGVIVFDQEDQILTQHHFNRSLVSVYSSHVRAISNSLGEVFVAAHYQVWENAFTTDVMKFSATGDLLWIKNIGDPSFTPEGIPLTTGSLRAAAIVADEQGGLYVFQGTSSVRLMQIASNGDLVWLKEHIPTSVDPSVFYQDMQRDELGNFHVSGFRENFPPIGNDNFILKFTPAGDLTAIDLYPGLSTLSLLTRLQVHGGERYLHGYSILRSDTLGSPATLYHSQSDADITQLAIKDD